MAESDGKVKMARGAHDSTVGDIGEFGLISRLFPIGEEAVEGLVCGIGDDAAAVRIPPDSLLLATCDAQIDGIHFRTEWVSAEEIGCRAAAVNLSDVASMGGKPRFALVSLALPPRTPVSFVEGLYAGLRSTFRPWNTVIIGGNMARMPDRLVVDITLLGEVRPGSMMRRDGAAAGELICVTGSLGASAAGLKILKEPTLSVSERHRKVARSAHCTPLARVLEGRFLGDSGRVSACIDVSDGLLQDMAHLANRSNVAAVIDASRVPIAECATHVALAAEEDPLAMALGGGEDFELLFTVSEASADGLIEDLRRETGTPASIIGRIASGSPRVTVEREGVPVTLPGVGFDHFSG